MNTLNEILSKYDSLDHKNFDESDVASDLNQIKDSSLYSDINFKAESFAFNFSESSNIDTRDSNSFFYAPTFVWKNNDGSVSETPSANELTGDIIKIWESRAIACINPILKARYSGLLWDFSKKVTGNRPSHEICIQHIKAILLIAEEKFCKYEYTVFNKLSRALNLSLSLKHEELAHLCKKSIIDFERRVATDEKPGLWGKAFDILIYENKGILEESEEKLIIQELEDRFSRLTDLNSLDLKINQPAIEFAARRLVKYFRTKNNSIEIKRILEKVLASIETFANEVSPFLSIHWLEVVQKLYKTNGLNDEADAVLSKIQTLSARVPSEMKRISHIMKITNEDMHVFTSSILKGEPEEIINNIANYFIPSKEGTKEKVIELSHEYPFRYIITQQLKDSKGRTVATIKPLADDLEGHLISEISRTLSYNSVFLNASIVSGCNQKLISKVSIEDFIKESPLINKDNYTIIEIALEEYFKNNHLAFQHLLIPQIESGLRNLLETCGGVIWKQGRSSGYLLKNLDEILRDEIIQTILEDDLSLYFRTLFTDQRGWNLRNKIAHGISHISDFSITTSDRVLHALLCLGLFKLEKKY
ncbi:hypothetical protein LPTSP3_g14980 [Leptospira kobayashii]|uniref:DUF4209 domain-containing protein n=1 Tax=Leptospira kobayashii TaxID=1917830 RepID=A0ABN6KC78_9LEPT|nr:DUF4209 domain-containing protein [Leptospira kobayashii]BDA78568.1 hypothetical protein LPTSP3_g14980 [Leptospira kobayashii]